jgi:hypothetical protein
MQGDVANMQVQVCAEINEALCNLHELQGTHSVTRAHQPINEAAGAGALLHDALQTVVNPASPTAGAAARLAATRAAAAAAAVDATRSDEDDILEQHHAMLTDRLAAVEAIEYMHPHDRWGKRVDKRWSTARCSRSFTCTHMFTHSLSHLSLFFLSRSLFFSYTNTHTHTHTHTHTRARARVRTPPTAPPSTSAVNRTCGDVSHAYLF